MSDAFLHLDQCLAYGHDREQAPSSPCVENIGERRKGILDGRVSWVVDLRADIPVDTRRTRRSRRVGGRWQRPLRISLGRRISARWSAMFVDGRKSCRKWFRASNKPSCRLAICRQRTPALKQEPANAHQTLSCLALLYQAQLFLASRLAQSGVPAAAAIRPATPAPIGHRRVSRSGALTRKPRARPLPAVALDPIQIRAGKQRRMEPAFAAAVSFWFGIAQAATYRTTPRITVGRFPTFASALRLWP